jgi:alpha-tubulin suppressor-like RCC1 family protein
MVRTPVPTGTAGWEVAAGTWSSCALGTSAGDIYCWGSNGYGELVTGDVAPHPSPTSISGVSFQHLSAGNHHFCGIDSGKLYCWGDNSNGQLGHNEGLTPQLVQSFP